MTQDREKSTDSVEGAAAQESPPIQSLLCTPMRVVEPGFMLGETVVPLQIQHINFAVLRRKT